MLKIIAGKYGSRTIEAPKGMNTRPTTNRVREAVFSALCSHYSFDMTLDEARVLDLFAGSGALSFEALSRGAEFVCLCEKNRGAIRTINKNCEILKVDRPNLKCLCIDSFSDRLLTELDKYSPFDIVFCDPPYAVDSILVADLINMLASSQILKQDTLVYYEHGDSDIKQIGETLYSRTFGEVKCDIFRI